MIIKWTALTFLILRLVLWVATDIDFDIVQCLFDSRLSLILNQQNTMNKVSSLKTNLQADAVSISIKLSWSDFETRIVGCLIWCPVFKRISIAITVSIVQMGEQVLRREGRTHWRRSFDSNATFKLLKKIWGLVDSHLNNIVTYIIVTRKPISSDDYVSSCALMFHLEKPWVIDGSWALRQKLWNWGRIVASPNVRLAHSSRACFCVKRTWSFIPILQVCCDYKVWLS